MCESASWTTRPSTYGIVPSPLTRPSMLPPAGTTRSECGVTVGRTASRLDRTGEAPERGLGTGIRWSVFQRLQDRPDRFLYGQHRDDREFHELLEHEDPRVQRRHVVAVEKDIAPRAVQASVMGQFAR